MPKRIKWSCQRVKKSLHPISKKEFEQRLDEVMHLLLDKRASSQNAFSTKIKVSQSTHASHGELKLTAEGLDLQPKERVTHDEAV